MDWERFNELVTLSDAGHVEEAIEGLQDLIDASESPEDNAGVLLIIGACQREIGRATEARKSLAKARSLANPESWIHPRAIFFDASIDFSQGNWRKALEKLERIEKDFSDLLNAPENGDLLEEVRRKRGIALYELHRSAEARPHLERAAEVEYERATSLYYLGRCCYDLGYLPQAKEALRGALNLGLDPVYQPSAHYVLGLAYHWTGQSGWAIPEFEWCLQNDKVDWKVLTAMVNALKALGMNDEAEPYAKTLKKLGFH